MSLYESLAGAGEKDGDRIYGVSVGIVTNNKDPESLGRVKIKLPLRECRNETDWARVATLMAGREMGSFFLPEVGDEVLVAFNEGDIRKPYVIGMLWNSVDKPPETNSDGKNNIRKIKSRSGNELIFTDEQGKEKIEIRTKNGNSILLDDGNKKVEIKDQSGNNKLVIDGNGNQVTVQANTKVEIKTQSCKVVLDSQGNSVTIESPMQLKIKAQTLDIEAGASLNIKSSGMLNIKGSMVKIN